MNYNKKEVFILAKKIKDYVHNVRVNKQDFSNAQQYCDDNLISMANELRKVIVKYSKLQQKTLKN